MDEQTPIESSGDEEDEQADIPNKPVGPDGLDLDSDADPEENRLAGVELGRLHASNGHADPLWATEFLGMIKAGNAWTSRTEMDNLSEGHDNETPLNSLPIKSSKRVRRPTAKATAGH